jgi:hypothetical protein
MAEQVISTGSLVMTIIERARMPDPIRVDEARRAYAAEPINGARVRELHSALLGLPTKEDLFKRIATRTNRTVEEVRQIHGEILTRVRERKVQRDEQAEIARQVKKRVHQQIVQLEERVKRLDIS